MHTGHMRITIRVRPGSGHPGAGGEHAGVLVVRVSAVTLVAGASSRTKIIGVAAGDPRILADLVTKPGRG
jgi:uncharacterized protein YggU (UPF0235/DUF167 family)